MQRVMHHGIIVRTKYGEGRTLIHNQLVLHNDMIERTCLSSTASIAIDLLKSVDGRKSLGKKSSDIKRRPKPKIIISLHCRHSSCHDLGECFTCRSPIHDHKSSSLSVLHASLTARASLELGTRSSHPVVRTTRRSVRSKSTRQSFPIYLCLGRDRRSRSCSFQS